MEIKVQDQTFSGEILNEISIQIQKEIITVKDIIEQRVIQEVEKYNASTNDYFNGFVQPTESEKALNGFKMKNKKKIDPEQQVYIALESFNSNGFFVLVNDAQVDSLDEKVLMNSGTTVSFLKLTPLVGG